MLFFGEAADRPISLLLVEDNDGDARLFREMLGHADFRVVHCRCLHDALATLQDDAFDVILLDLGLPDSEGLETLRRAAAHQLSAPVIVVLTGLDDERLAIDAVREGAQDYLVKGQLDSNVLTRAIRYALERHNLQLALEQARQEAEAARQRDFYAALTEVRDLAGEQPEPTTEALAQLQTDYQRLGSSFIQRMRGEGMAPMREAVRDFSVRAAGLRLRARHVVHFHLRALDALEAKLSGTSVLEVTTELRLFLVEVLGNMMDIYLSVYRVMQPSEHPK